MCCAQLKAILACKCLGEFATRGNFGIPGVGGREKGPRRLVTPKGSVEYGAIQNTRVVRKSIKNESESGTAYMMMYLAALAK